MNESLNTVLTFIGERWWLIFLLPVFGGIVRSTFGSGKSRRRRLEQRRADRHGGYQSREQNYEPQPEVFVPVEKSPAQLRLEETQRLFVDHDAVNARWLDYELDVAKLIDFPMMSDVREPLTVEFLRAKRLADGLRPESPSGVVNDAQLSEYRQALRNFEVSFDVAEREARRIKDAHYTEPERQRLGTVRKLFTMAVDDASTQAEKQLAYSRARKELDGLLVLPEEAIAALEQRIQAQLLPGTTPVAEPILRVQPRMGHAE